MVNLIHLERYDEAAPRLPAVRELAIEQGRRLDQTRLRWLAAKLAAGEGRTEEAKAGLQQVIEDFADLSYEAALASLDPGRLRRGKIGSNRIVLPGQPGLSSSPFGFGKSSECPRTVRRCEPILHPRRRPAVPVDYEAISLRTWDVSTPYDRPSLPP